MSSSGPSTPGSLEMDNTPLHWTQTVSRDMLEDWITDLRRRNRVEVQNALNQMRGSTFECGTAKFIFVTSKRLGMSPAICYLSLELFNRFAERHEQNLNTYLVDMLHKERRRRGSLNYQRRKQQEWGKIVKRAKEQVTLRVLSCMQLASKVVEHYQELSPQMVKRYLKDVLKKGYSLKSILTSEMRVLSTLSFQMLVPTPLDYVESLLAVQNERVKTRIFYQACVRLIDISYLEHRKLYDGLFASVTGRMMTTEEDKAKFACVEADYLYLGSAVVTAASYLVCQDQASEILQNLNASTDLVVHEIVTLATLLLEVGLGEKK